jgi:hypothetical protein
VCSPPVDYGPTATMCFGARDKGEVDGAARSRELDKEIRAAEKRMAKEVKLLLLGRNYPQCSPFSRCRADWLEFDCRCWRVGKVHGVEANEVDLRPRV